MRLRAYALLSLCLLALFPALATAQIVTSLGPGSNATVRVIEPNGTDRSFLAYPAGFGGGSSVALGDIDGDGVLDIITGAGPGGGPHVRVWNGATLAEIGGFFAYDPAFPGGVSVAAGDVNGDGHVDIITGAGPGGGPHVRVWSGVDFSEIGGFFAYFSEFRGGVSVAAGDVNGDGKADIITGAGPGGGPHVRVWSGADFTEIGGFFAYFSEFRGGVHVAAGDVNGDGLADIITGAGSGGGPHVRVWNGATLTEIGGFFAYDPAFQGGVTVGAIDLTYDGRVEILTAPGPGAGPLVAIWNNTDFSLLGAYFAFDPAFLGGVSLASPGSSNAVRFTSAATTTFSVTTPGTFAVTTVGGALVPTLTVTGALPSGVTFTDNGDRTGVLAGPPGAGTGGTYPLTFTATSGTATPVTQAFTLLVNQAPAITSAAATTFGLGGPSTFTVTTTGFPAPTLSTTGGLPDGVTFVDNGNGTATLAGTPAAGSGGTYPFTITATNGVGTAATQAFVLTVNASPVFTSAIATTFTAGTAGSFLITTTATPQVTSISRTGALPGGVSFTYNANGTATLAGTPAAGSGGTYTLTFTAANGVGTDAVQTFTLTVREAPAITSAASDTFIIGTSDSFTVTTTGFPTPGLVQGGATLPSGVTFVDNGNGTGTLAGMPGAGTAGPYALTFTASNGIGSPALQNFTLTVACAATTVSPAAGALAQGTFLQAYSQTFTAVGGSGHTFTVTAGTVPSGLGLAPGGALTGSPTTTGNFSFTVTATDSVGCTGQAAYTLAVKPNAAFEGFNNAVGNTQYVVAPAPTSPTPAVLAVSSVLANDQGPSPLSAGPAVIATTNGGTVAMGANGAFVYTPAIGFIGPADTFTYTLTDGNGITATAVVTIGFAGEMVWYVNSSGGNGDGRSHNPFNNMISAEAASGVAHTIYVHAGAATTPGAIDLKSRQTLWGAGAAFVLNGLTIPATSNPTLTGSVTLADDARVNSLSLNVSLAPAIVAINLTGTETVNAVTILGGTSGFNLLNMGGVVNVTNSNISGVSGAEVRISGGNGTVNMGAAITNTVGLSVDVQGRFGGTVTFSGLISDNGTGVLLDNNPGSTINFTGGLALNTGTSTAFTATNGGTVSATQNNVTIINTLSTTSGTALYVVDTAIGGAGLTFRAISANGAVNGIVLNNTGAGAFAVLGTGTTLGSGGAIQNTTNRGASFIGASNITLRNMNFINTATVDLVPVNSGLSTGNNLSDNAAIHLQSVTGVTLDRIDISGSSEQGINGNTVSDFALTNSTIQSAGDAADEDGLHFFNMLGTNTIGATSIISSGDDNVNIQNASGTSTITITGGAFNTGALGSGLLFGPRGTTDTTINISGVTIDDNFSGGIVADASDTATMTVTVNQATITNNNDGIQVSGANGNVAFDINDVDINNNDFLAITVLKAALSTTGALQGFIRNSQIAVANGRPTDALSIFDAGGGSMTVAISDNTIDYAGTQRAMFVQGGQDGNGAMNITATGNTIDMKLDGSGDAVTGILAQAAVTGPGNTTSLCADIGGGGASSNTFTHSLGGTMGAGDIRVRQRNDGTVQLPGYGGAAGDGAAVMSYLNGRNIVISASTATLDSTGFAGGGGCVQPIVP